MPFLTLNNDETSLAEYYNSITTEGVFIGTQNNPNVTGTEKPKIPEALYTDFDDGFVRGGVNNIALSVARDTTRLFKFLTGTAPTAEVSLKNIGTDPDKLRGYLFLAKQASLQLTNPRLEWDRRDALPPLLGGPTRQFTGVGLIESIAGTAFGLHFDRAGLFGRIRDDQKYGGDVDTISGITYRNNFGKDNNNSIINDKAHNRLVRYLDKIVTTGREGDSIILDRYFGGPGSVYGLGYTTVRTSYDNRTTIRTNDLGVPEKTAYAEVPNFVLGLPTFEETLSGELDLASTIVPYKIPEILPNPELQIKLNGFTPTTNNELISYPNPDNNKVTTITPSIKKTASPPGYNLEDRFGVSTNSGPGSTANYLDAVNTIQIVGSDIFYGNEGTDSSGVNAYVEQGRVQGKFGEDLIKFRIEFLNNESLTTKINGATTVNTDVLAFRAYIDAFDDGMSAKWSSYRYMGRGEEFYVYEGFSRDINVAFTIHAHSEGEMAQLYNKLNYLMSTFTPDYSTNYKMRGNIGYLTVGDYVFRQPGVFTDIKVGGMLDGSWEIGLDNNGAKNGEFQLPKMLKISLSFKPIHTFLPRRNYSSKASSGNVGQNFPAPFVTPDRNAYPVKRSDGKPNNFNDYISFTDAQVKKTTTASGIKGPFKCILHDPPTKKEKSGGKGKAVLSNCVRWKDANGIVYSTAKGYYPDGTICPT